MQGSLQKQRGFLLYLAVILISVIGFLGVTITQMYGSSAYSQVNYSLATKALYLSEAGLEHASRQLLNYNPTNRSTCSGLSLSGTLGSGTYT
ncbi:MAG: hypothetical protein M3Q64_02870, partial [bacterium]|nr:hypothetical protein [bacterium]